MPIKIIDNIVIRGSKLYYILRNPGLSRCNPLCNTGFPKCPPSCITGFKVCPFGINKCPFRGCAESALCNTARN